MVSSVIDCGTTACDRLRQEVCYGNRGPRNSSSWNATSRRADCQGWFTHLRLGLIDCLPAACGGSRERDSSRWHPGAVYQVALKAFPIFVPLDLMFCSYIQSRRNIKDIAACNTLGVISSP